MIDSEKNKTVFTANEKNRLSIGIKYSFKMNTRKRSNDSDKGETNNLINDLIGNLKVIKYI